ncbi:tetratricopeptide repeat protein [Candidatus Obscuribacterales bacterium]|nr:tetratricopeptide repeat protein [Candidatus Obscuribacterales bacterium]
MTSYGHERLWDAYIKDFKTAFIKDDLETAKTVLDAAFADAEDYLEIDFRLVASTHSLASSYCVMNRETEARALYEKFIELREKVMGPEDPDVAESLERVAVLQLDAFKRKKLSVAI